MPDLGLFSATEPLSLNANAMVKYVEVEGLPVYTQNYGVAKAASELDESSTFAVELWARRIICVVGCRDNPDGQCCEWGRVGCTAVE